MIPINTIIILILTGLVPTATSNTRSQSAAGRLEWSSQRCLSPWMMVCLLQQVGMKYKTRKDFHQLTTIWWTDNFALKLFFSFTLFHRHLSPKGWKIARLWRSFWPLHARPRKGDQPLDDDENTNHDENQEVEENRIRASQQLERVEYTQLLPPHLQVDGKVHKVWK